MELSVFHILDWRLLLAVEAVYLILFDRKKDPDEMDNLFGRPGYEEITARLAGKILDRMQLENVPERLIPRALAGYAGRDNG